MFKLMQHYKIQNKYCQTTSQKDIKRKEKNTFIDEPLYLINIFHRKSMENFLLEK